MAIGGYVDLDDTQTDSHIYSKQEIKKLIETLVKYQNSLLEATIRKEIEGSYIPSWFNTKDLTSLGDVRNNGKAIFDAITEAGAYLINYVNENYMFVVVKQVAYAVCGVICYTTANTLVFLEIKNTGDVLIKEMAQDSDLDDVKEIHLEKTTGTGVLKDLEGQSDTSENRLVTQAKVEALIALSGGGSAVQDETGLGDLSIQANGKKFWDKVTEGGAYKINFNGAIRTFFVSFVNSNQALNNDICGFTAGSNTNYGYVLCIKSDGTYKQIRIASYEILEKIRNLYFEDSVGQKQLKTLEGKASSDDTKLVTKKYVDDKGLPSWLATADLTDLGRFDHVENCKKLYNAITKEGFFKIQANGYEVLYLVTDIDSDRTHQICGIIHKQNDQLLTLCLRKDGTYSEKNYADYDEFTNLQLLHILKTTGVTDFFRLDRRSDDKDQQLITVAKTEALITASSGVADKSVTFLKLDNPLQNDINKIRYLDADSVVQKDFTILGITNASLESGFNAGNFSIYGKLNLLLTAFKDGIAFAINIDGEKWFFIAGTEAENPLIKNVFGASLRNSSSDFYDKDYTGTERVIVGIRYDKQVELSGGGGQDEQGAVALGFEKLSSTGLSIEWKLDKKNHQVDDDNNPAPNGNWEQNPESVDDEHFLEFLLKSTVLSDHPYVIDKETRTLGKTHLEILSHDDKHTENEHVVNLKWDTTENKFVDLLKGKGHIKSIEYAKLRAGEHRIRMTQHAVFKKARFIIQITADYTTTPNFELHWGNIIASRKLYFYNKYATSGNTSSAYRNEARSYALIIEGNTGKSPLVEMDIQMKVTNDGQDMVYLATGFNYSDANNMYNIFNQGAYDGNSPFRNKVVDLILRNSSGTAALTFGANMQIEITASEIYE